MHTRHFAAATVLALLITTFALVTTWQPAGAATLRFTDPVDSRYAPDLRRITVVHKRRLTVIAHHSGTPMSQYTLIRYWIDSRPRNPGPEFFVMVIPNSDGLTLRRSETWKQERGNVVRCPGLRAHADYLANDALRLSVPRRCLGNPSRVRVAIRVEERYADRNFSDWAAGRHRFMPPVHR